MKRPAMFFLILVALAGSAFAAPATVSTPTPLSTGGAALLRFSGQILDFQSGFIFFTTGDGYRVASDVRFVDFKTGQPTNLRPVTRMYARATFNAQGVITEVALAQRPMPGEATYDQVHVYAVTKSVQAVNPEYHNKNSGIEGKPVLVSFIVTVPPTTPLTDQVYMATDKSGWQPNAIRMDRIDALRYRYTARLNSGTDISYLFTRGTWTTVERGQNGLEQKPHHLFVQNLDTENRNNQVYYWADQAAGGGAPNAQATFNPSALPTPYNPSPFNFPSPVPRPRPTPAA